MPTYLRGRACAVLEHLENTQKDTCEHLVAALQEAFQPKTAEDRRRARPEFQHRRLQPNEALEVFLEDLEATSPEMAPALREDQLINQFIEGLPASLRDAMQGPEHRQQTLAASITRAEEL